MIYQVPTMLALGFAFLGVAWGITQWHSHKLTVMIALMQQTHSWSPDELNDPSALVWAGAIATIGLAGIGRAIGVILLRRAAISTT